MSGPPTDASCKCNANYNWNQELSACVRDCAAISDDLSNKMSVGIDECQCVSEAAWNQTEKKCYRNCGLVDPMGRRLNAVLRASASAWTPTS